MRPDPRRRFALRPTSPRTRRVQALTRRSPCVGLAGVLADLDRTGAVDDVPGEAVVCGFRWDEHDVHDARWWPQGVALAPPGDVLLATWYSRRPRLGLGQGARLTVVDLRDARRPRYRHVRLVVPRALGGSGPVRVHAGGIAVVAGLLLLADTVAGVRVFRLDDVLRTADGYALPQLLRLRLSVRSGMRCSFLSVADVDGTPSLLVGEYRREGAAPRLLRYPLDPATALLRGTCLPVEVHERQPPRMQGVTVVDGTWFVSASAGEGRPGDLHVGRPGAFRRHRGVLPTGPEDLDAAPDGDRLWCLTEWPGRRWVFQVDPVKWRDGVDQPPRGD